MAQRNIDKARRAALDSAFARHATRTQSLVRAARAHSAWVLNCWYVIAWSHEVPAVDDGGFLARTALGEPLLVYRRSDGGVVVMEDRCCHRHAPLSAGRREGDCVRCGYHGLKFDSCGTCVEIPGIANIPAKVRVRTFPAVEKNRWIFFWPGDPEKADPALVPDNFSCDHPDWEYRPGYLHYEAPYLLICDNLLDFSHLSYVHERTVGGSTAIAQSPATVEKTVDAHGRWNGVKVTRKVRNVPPAPYYRKFRPYEGLVDRWFTYDFVLPGTLLMHSGARPAGTPEDDDRATVRLHSCQTLTPETESSTHYFFQQACQRTGSDPETCRSVAEAIHAGVVAAFEEDRAMIQKQFRTIQHDPDAPMVPLAMDSALVQFRRMLAERVAQEADTSGRRTPAPPLFDREGLAGSALDPARVVSDSSTPPFPAPEHKKA